MSAQPNYFRIGLFILLAIVIVTTALVAFGAGQFFRKRITIETYLDSSVQGVEKGSPVKYRGVLVGSVRDITFAFNTYQTPEIYDPETELRAPGGENFYNYVVILMEIDKEMFPDMFSQDLTSLIAKNVKRGMRARIEPQGITGMNYIDVNYIENPSRYPALPFDWTPEHYYIPSAPGQLTSILNSVNNMMGEISGMMDELKRLNLGDVQSGLSQLLKNLNKAVTGAEMAKLSQGLQTLIGDLNKAVREADIGALSTETRTLISGLEKSNEKLQKVLSNLDESTQFDPAEIRSIIDSLNETSENLEAFSFAVKKRPSVLLWGSPAKPDGAKQKRE